MQKASISETKNNLSRLLDAVRQGESVMIFDRDMPVAVIEPIADFGLDDTAWINARVRREFASPPRQRLDAQEYLKRDRPAVAAGASAVRALVRERMDGR